MANQAALRAKAHWQLDEAVGLMSPFDLPVEAKADLRLLSPLVGRSEQCAPGRVELSTVTLCAATSVNLPATIAALRLCLEQIDFAECLLFTDRPVVIDDKKIRIVPISRLETAYDYSKFILNRLVDYLSTDHCLIVQWDGFVIDAKQWDFDFLSYDYIGATWPHFADHSAVGNGGFSLRSRKLLEACRDPRFLPCHPEDVAICRLNRELLRDSFGIRFADHTTAERFAFERSMPKGRTFGFHGIFNLISALGPERFWQIYNGLDDRSTAFTDYRLLIRQLGGGRDALRRRTRLTADLLKSLVRRRITVAG